mmetsp:Transcript_11705/g.17786  ORF Transcript_11705/g.17786 Transcript_11705/m.17786 type:complete len:92 (+) Transcript_11705:916-1191(+)
MVKEFIKIKPRGFFFHNTYFYPFQSLINWFKTDFRSTDYQRFLRRAPSPQLIGKAVQPDPRADVEMMPSVGFGRGAGRPDVPTSPGGWNNQ